MPSPSVRFLAVLLIAAAIQCNALWAADAPEKTPDQTAAAKSETPTEKKEKEEKKDEKAPEKSSAQPADSTPATAAMTDAEKAQAAQDEDWKKRFEEGRRKLKISHPWEAEKILGQCLEESKTFANEDKRKSDAYTAMADVEVYLGRHEKALPLYDEARRLIESQVGKDSIHSLMALLGQAKCKAELEKPSVAEALYQEAIALAERAKNDSPEAIYYVKNEVEFFLKDIGQFARAEKMCRDRLETLKTVYKVEADIVLLVRTQLLDLILAQGRIEEGRELGKQIAKEADELPGLKPRNHSWIYYKTGSTFADAHDFATAKVYLNRTLEICEKKPKGLADHAGFALIAMGRIELKMGNFSEAENAYTRALKIWEDMQGPPRIIECLQGLSTVYVATKDWDKAAAATRRALEVQDEAYGKSRKSNTRLSEILGRHLIKAGQYAEAEKIYRQALATHEENLGPFALDAAEDRFLLGLLAAKQGRSAEALAEYEKGVGALMEARMDNLPQVSPQERQAMNASQAEHWNALFSFCCEEQDKLPKATALAVDAALRYQGSLLSMGTANREALFAASDPKLKETLEQIATLETRIAKMLRSKDSQESDALREYQSAKAKVMALEDELSRACAPYARQRQLREAQPADIRKTLPADSALVLVLGLSTKYRFLKDDFNPWYVAFVLDSDGESALIDLGYAEPVDKTLGQFRTAISEAAGGVPAAESAHAEAARNLSNQLLAPLHDRMKNKSRWFFILDGPIAKVNVALLPVPGGDALVLERHEVSYLTRASEILGFARTNLASADLRILADPDFDAKAADGDAAARTFFDGLKWKRLPGTRAEAESIAELFNAKHLKVDLKTGADATRQALLAGPAPRFLHIATHGFSLPEKFTAQDVANVRGLAGVVSVKEAEAAHANAGSTMICEQCGRVHVCNGRSGRTLPGPTGLVLAGAGQTGRGVVLAEELRALNLFGTEMVVLSACESGLGDLAAGEGVQGLRSAFLESGARSLVTSLWKVPDRETKDLMCAFYRHVLAGERKSKAMQQAMLETRAKLQKEKGGAHPFYWAGFILVGNPD